MLGKFWGNTNKGGFSVNLLRISLISTSRGTYTNQFKCPVETFELFIFPKNTVNKIFGRNKEFHRNHPKSTEGIWQPKPWLLVNKNVTTDVS